MRKYKFLCLTDHQSHSAENSIYSLLSELYQHPKCASVYVASRSVERNREWFTDPSRGELYGTALRGEWKYASDGYNYTSHLTSVDPAEVDVLWLRLPHPVSETFLTSLPHIFTRAVIINRPSGILRTSSKAYLLQYPQLCPPMAICHTTVEISDMAAKHPIVLKPLRGYGGHGIVKIDGEWVTDGEHTRSLAEFFKEKKDYIADHGFLAMKYLHRVSEGDKRLLYVDGTLLAGILRLPAQGQWLCNVAQGGRSAHTTVTPDEQHIIAELTPDLRAQGIVIAGIDTLVDDDGRRILSEINTLSIGGFPQAQAQTGIPIVSITIQKIIDYVDRHI